jgi:hypothetical protein
MSSQKSDKKEDSKLVESTRIKQLINKDRFQKLQETKTVVRFDLVKTLIEGTEDEYYNKLQIKDTLHEKAVKDLIGQLTDDDTYDWDSAKMESPFEPKEQFLLKGTKGELTLLLDADTRRVAFIDLYGQQLANMDVNLIFENIIIKK